MGYVRFRLIACEVLFRELSVNAARSTFPVDCEYLPKGLHDLGGQVMRQQLQERIDQVDPKRYSAVLMGYALCGNGLAGIEARTLPVVIPRAHDCIALLLGSRKAYDEIMEQNPGTYFRSPGWVERGGDTLQLTRIPEGRIDELAWLMEKYGEENGRYVYEELHRYRQKYSRLIYIETGVEPDGRLKEEARKEAEAKAWAFEARRGSLNWFRKLVTGDWDSDFLVLEPGQRCVVRFDEFLLHAEETSK